MQPVEGSGNATRNRSYNEVDKIGGLCFDSDEILTANQRHYGCSRFRGGFYIQKTDISVTVKEVAFVNTYSKI